MLTFTIENETKKITAHATAQEADAVPNAERFRSHRKGLTERLLFFVGARVRRCRACDVRFARLFSSTVYIDDARRVLRRVAIVLCMATGVVLVLITVLRLINEQAAIRPSD
jgi:hypothetical protein